MKDNLLILILNVLFGAAGALIVNRYAFRLGLVDTPSSRSSHSIPTPKGGGIGILFAFVTGCVIYDLDALFYLPATALSLLSLLGDRIHIPLTIRLVVQFAAAFLFIFSLPDLPFCAFYSDLLGCHFSITFFGGILAAVYIVGTANFYNFMDGINGIAAMTSIVGFGLLAGYGTVYFPNSGWLMVCFGLAAACAGFLPFNVPKAKVFMGDVGSILLGFVFASLVVMSAENFTEFLMLTSFLFPFYADELVTMVERIRNRQRMTTPHRYHLYQVLVNEAGVAHWKVSLGYAVFQLLVGAGLWHAKLLGTVWLVAGLISVWMLFLWVNNAVKRKYARIR